MISITSQRREAIVRRVVDLDSRIEALLSEPDPNHRRRTHRMRNVVRRLAIILWADNAADGCFHTQR